MPEPSSAVTEPALPEESPAENGHPSASDQPAPAPPESEATESPATLTGEPTASLLPVESAVPEAETPAVGEPAAPLQDEPSTPEPAASVADEPVPAATEPDAPLPSDTASTDDGPVSTDDAPVSTDDAPVSTDDAPVSMEDAPVSVPDEAVAGPAEAVAGPDATVVGDDAAVSTPDAVLSEPDAFSIDEAAPPVSDLAEPEAETPTSAPDDPAFTEAERAAALAATGQPPRGGDRGRRERPERPKRPRRRRATAAERHRRAFFAQLTAVRGALGLISRTPPADASPAVAEEPVAEVSQDAGTEEVASAPGATPVAPEAAVAPEATPVGSEAAPVAPEPVLVAPEPADPVLAEPAAEGSETVSAVSESSQAETPTEAPTAASVDGAQPEAPGDEAGAAVEDATPTVPAGARLSLSLAIERVGTEAVKVALAPRRDEKDEPMKWAVVCAESAQGLQSGDPTFIAWVRLAATPVRDVKRELAIATGEAPRERPRGRRPDDRQGGGDRSRAGGGDRGRPGGGDRSRSGGGRPAGRSGPPSGDLRDGSFSTRVRIVTDDREDRRANERQRKEQRDAKLKADRERLARLGY